MNHNTRQQVLDYFRALLEDHIEQRTGEYYPPQSLLGENPDSPDFDKLPKPDCHCVGVHFGFALGTTLQQATDGLWYLSSDDGAESMAYACSDLMPYGEDNYEDEFAQALTANGAPSDPFSTAPWLTSPAIVLQRTFAQLEAGAAARS